jgi:hypothetical protein
LPEIDLHDVRHSHPTAGCDAKIDWKALSWDGPRGGVSEASSPIAAYLVFWQAGAVADFDELVTEALAAPFSGWDFSSGGFGEATRQSTRMPPAASPVLTTCTVSLGIGCIRA